MHILEAQLHAFLDSVKKQGLDFNNPEYYPLIKDFRDSCKRALVKQFSKRDEEFTLRMSNIGRPSCILWMEKNGVEGENPSHHLIRNLYGDMVEALVVFILKAAGIKVVAEQLPVSLEIDGETISGTLDVILEINGEQSVWDIKSASDWSFNQKHTFADMVKDDIFGYVGQLFGYSRAANKTAGGWIIANKSTGEIRVIGVDRKHPYIKRLEDGSLHSGNIKRDRLLLFSRAFSDIPERFRKRETGNRILSGACKLCPYKFPCWPGLRPLLDVNSKANNPKLKYYTFLKENPNEST